jgi:hypothetical protein
MTTNASRMIDGFAKLLRWLSQTDGTREIPHAFEFGAKRRDARWRLATVNFSDGLPSRGLRLQRHRHDYTPHRTATAAFYRACLSGTVTGLSEQGRASFQLEESLPV